MSWLYCISTNKSFSSSKTSSRTPYSNNKQQEKQKHSAENTINFSVDVTICLGDETVTQHCRVLDTDAFDIVIGTDFLRRNPQVKMLSLQRPYSLHCDFGSGLFSVPLELSGRKESGLRYAAKTNYRTENHQLARHVLENGLAALQVNLDEIQVELFASQQQHIMQLYSSKQMNNAFRFFWKAMGLAYANPPFSLLEKVLTKIAYEGGRVVMCTPD